MGESKSTLLLDVTDDWLAMFSFVSARLGISSGVLFHSVAAGGNNDACSIMAGVETRAPVSACRLFDIAMVDCKTKPPSTKTGDDTESFKVLDS